MEESWSPPGWWYVDKRPSNDDACFENMSRVIFQAGLNWSVVEKKWSTIRKAFEGFSVRKVARFSERDVSCLMKDPGLIRNRGKIKAIIENAKEFERIDKEYDSFQKFLDGLDKSHNYSPVVKELSARFKWLGPSSATIFLFTVGEKIKHTW